MKKKILFISVWTLLIISLAIVLGFIVKKHESTECRDVVININYPAKNYFITKQDIQNYIHRMGDSIKGRPLSRIDIETLELMIRNNPYVANAEVYMTLNGVVRIDVMQRKPIVRIQNRIGQRFYISDDGRLMPLNPGKPALVPLANGEINDIYLPGLNLNADTAKRGKDTSIMKTDLYKIFCIAQYLQRDTFFNAQIEQIYLNKNKDIELVPMVGSHLIIFGDAENMQEKFEKLLIFYKQGLSVEGWDKYDTINLKFHNQVVCTNIEKK
jgi:cell division protein FtsQ